jgi:hypothetical protein
MNSPQKKIKGYKNLEAVSFSDTAWKSSALCSDKDLSIFFATSKSDTTLTAISICKRCPVRFQCFYEALEYGYDGTWGGSTVDQRQVLIRSCLDSDLSNLNKTTAEQMFSLVDKIGRTKSAATVDIYNYQKYDMEKHV